MQDHQMYSEENMSQVSTIKKDPTNKRRIQEERFAESAPSESEESDASSIYIADKRRLTNLQKQKVQEQLIGR